MPARDDEKSAFAFTSAEDAHEEVFRNFSYSTGIIDNKDHSTYRFDLEQMQSPIRLKVQNYPNYLEGEEKIDIDIK